MDLVRAPGAGGRNRPVVLRTAGVSNAWIGVLGRLAGYAMGVWRFQAPPGDQDLTCRVEGHGTDDVRLQLGGTLSRDPASRRFQRCIEREFVDDGVRRIHLDLHDLEAIDLEGVAVLVHLFRESQRRGKPLTVERSTGAVRRRLHTTGILRIMEPGAASA